MEEEEDTTILNNNHLSEQQQLQTNGVNFTSKKGMEREDFYKNFHWDGGKLFGSWFKSNWFLIDDDVFGLLKLYRILDQMMFLSGLGLPAREPFVKEVLQESALTVIAMFTTQLQALQARVVELRRKLEKLVDVKNSSFKWDGESLFSNMIGNNWHKAKDEIIPTLKLCRLVDQVMFAAGIDFKTRKSLMESDEITTAKKVRELMKIQLLALETQMVKIKLHIEKKIESNHDSGEGSSCNVQ